MKAQKRPATGELKAAREILARSDEAGAVALVHACKRLRYSVEKLADALAAVEHEEPAAQQPPRASAARPASSPSSAPAAGVEGFAASVAEAASHVSGDGRFGFDKVFISHLFRAWRETNPGTTYEQFKSQLVAAHRAGGLSLSRADLVEAMDPRDVAESETSWLSQQFHFYRVPRLRDGAW